jgi:hypothetical protein
MIKPVTRMVRTGILLIAAALLAACGTAQPSASQPGLSQPGPSQSSPSRPSPSQPIPSALLSEARPIGTGPRFQPPATGPVSGRCEASLGARNAVHVEVFAANRVLLLPAGIGTRPPQAMLSGRITTAGCYGALVTLDTTGVVLVRSGSRQSLGELFQSWGEPLSPERLASFGAAAGSRVAVFVDGQRWHGTPGAVPLTPHAEIVLEVGPHVPPHASYTFPPGS